jgi:NAD(P)-dependent dehydrogenase (short-subunit alcohol dehydrogenase family)
MEKPLSGKIYVITGATSGIGLAAAEQLVQDGATLIGLGRSEERCKEIEAGLNSKDTSGRADFITTDLSVQANVRQAAREISEKLEKLGTGLDGLINNAGTFLYKRTMTPDGFETQWAVNHLAPFMLTHELLPLLRQMEMARVVTVSSGSHYNARMRWDDLQLEKRYFSFLAYRQTKLANVLFTAELNRRLGPASPVRAFAADPGMVNTAIGAKEGPRLFRWLWKVHSRRGKSADEAARGVVFLAADPSIQDSPDIYWKNCQPKPPDPYALDPENAHRLWEISEKMCGITDGNYPPQPRNHL